MNLAQLYAGDGGTTGYNGSYSVNPDDTARLNVTTEYSGGLLTIKTEEVFLVNGAWVVQTVDMSVYAVMGDGRIMTLADMVTDPSGKVSIQKYHGDCLLADATLKSVTSSGSWEWSCDGGEVGQGTYYFVVEANFDAAMQNGNTFQMYMESSDGVTSSGSNVNTMFENGVCVWYAQQSIGPVENGPSRLYIRRGDRV